MNVELELDRCFSTFSKYQTIVAVGLLTLVEHVKDLETPLVTCIDEGATLLPSFRVTLFTCTEM